MWVPAPRHLRRRQRPRPASRFAASSNTMESGRFMASKSNCEKHCARRARLRGALFLLPRELATHATHCDKLVRNRFSVEFLHWPANCDSAESEPRNVQHNGASNKRIQAGEQPCLTFDLHLSIDDAEKCGSGNVLDALPDIPTFGGWREVAARAVVASEVSAPRVCDRRTKSHVVCRVRALGRPCLLQMNAIDPGKDD
jgi:hypothetical protein